MGGGGEGRRKRRGGGKKEEGRRGGGEEIQGNVSKQGTIICLVFLKVINFYWK